MKKLLSFVLVAVLCMGMTTTVFAANSPSINNTTTIPTGSTVIDGVEVTLEIKTVEAAKADMSLEQQAKIDEVLTVVNSGNTSAIVEMQKTLIEEVAKEEVSTIGYSKLVDVALPVGQTVPAGGIQITITDSNIKAGMNIVMLHLKGDGTWENIPVSVANGAIVGTFTSLSPVYYFELVEESTVAPNVPVDIEYSAATVAPYVPADIEYSAANGAAMRWISSEENGNISISGTQTSIPAGSKFSARAIFSGDAYSAVATAVANAKGAVDFVAYDFNLTDAAGNAITKFSGHADVSMPVPAGLDVAEGQTVVAYYVNNGKLEKCNTVVDNGFVTFGTTHLSTFVYVAESASSAASTPVSASVASPKTAENNMVLYVTMLAIVALGSAVYTTRKVK